MEFDADASIEDFEKIFEVGLYKDRPACRVFAFEKDVSPIMMAGMMTAILDSMISAVPENKQINFEASVLETFEDMVKSRFEYVNKYRLHENES